MTEFIRQVTFGHGSVGNECVLCGETDYRDGLTHKDGCLYAAIRAEVLRDVVKAIRDPGRHAVGRDAALAMGDFIEQRFKEQI